MSYKVEVLKAIKSCLKSYGFKYKEGYFENTSNPRVTINLLFSMENHFKSHYFYVGMGALIIIPQLNEMLYELTESMVDLQGKTGPICLRTFNSEYGTEEIHSEFYGAKDMEENIRNFNTEITDKIMPAIQVYQTMNDVISALVSDNQKEQLSIWAFYYIPIAYYLKGEYAKALQYIDEYIIRQKELNNMRPNKEYICQIKIFEIYRKNLIRWIDSK